MNTRSGKRGRPAKDATTNKPSARVSAPNKALRTLLEECLRNSEQVRSITALARAGGINTSVISMALAGHRPLSLNSAMAIAKALAAEDSADEIPKLARKLFLAG